jgi:hypothetical protein
MGPMGPMMFDGKKLTGEICGLNQEILKRIPALNLLDRFCWISDYTLINPISLFNPIQ